ncbi:hypothetical protein [Tardiphaga sp.]|uniref:hypothetical protein n=1 Tax=Tardiphaga sp. TaxID=1926292 RepID=UPI0026163095|nr:hypothetical protein [Tardiphaga sp.]
MAAEQAIIICVAMLALARGHDIGKDSHGYFARPRKRAYGPARQLRDIARMAKKAIAGKKVDSKKWRTAWVALSLAVRQVWKPLVKTNRGWRLDRSTILTYRSPGFTTVIPKPEYVLPDIVAELARRTKEGRSKIRRPGEPEHAAIRSVQTAYQTLTGKSGRRTVRDGRRTGPYHRFCLEIDQIFGTTLFTKRDGGRDR